MPSYAITDLGAFTGYGLNNAGQVVGYNDGAVLWQNGGLIGLGAANSSNALAVNDAGQVAGYRILGGSNFHAFVWDPSLGFTDLGTLPNRPYSQAADLNEVGQVVGRSQGTNVASSLEGAHAFLWDSSNGMQDLGTFGQNSSTATAINQPGQVVGFAQYSQSGMTTFATQNAAFFRDSSGATTLLGTLPGQLYSKALDINDLGQVAGSAGDYQVLPHSVLYRPQEAFVWQNGVMTGLGKPAGYLRSEAVANNNAGQVVGFAYSSTSNGFAGHPFLWQNGAWTDLGFSYAFSVDINDLGQILVVTPWSGSTPPESYLLNPDTITTLAVSGVTVTEGNAGTMTAVFTVTRSGPTDQITTVAFSTANGTASAASDYVAASGTVTFNLGETSQTITVAVNGDTLNEANESFFVNLSNPVNAFVADGQGVGTILNDDPVPSITINDVAQVEGNAGITYFVFTVSLSAASGQTVMVNFATANGTATVSSNDYLATSGTLTFAPGETTKTILVAVKGDTKKEANETFFLNLSGALNALIADAQGLGTILNDD